MIERIKYFNRSQWLHVLVGGAFIGLGIYEQEWIPGLAGAYLVVKGYFGWGCVGSCGIPKQPRSYEN